MTGSDQFVVIVSEKRFVLTRAQIEFDSPNYFSKWFIENSPENHGQALELSRDPDLFRLIINHLSGYSVVSLSPPKISLPDSRTLKDLLSDVAFYELASLKSLCEQLLEVKTKDAPRTKRNSSERFMVITGTHNSGKKSSTLAELLLKSRDTYLLTSVEEDKLGDSDFYRPTTPQSCSGFDGVRELGAVRSVVKELLGTDYDTSWRIVGWKKPESYQAEKVVIVLEAQPDQDSV